MSPLGHSSTLEIQAKYFSQLDESLLKRIQNKYWPDFLLYGYDLEPFLKLLQQGNPSQSVKSNLARTERKTATKFNVKVVSV